MSAQTLVLSLLIALLVIAGITAAIIALRRNRREKTASANLVTPSTGSGT